MWRIIILLWIICVTFLNPSYSQDVDCDWYLTDNYSILENSNSIINFYHVAYPHEDYVDETWQEVLETVYGYPPDGMSYLGNTSIAFYDAGTDNDGLLNDNGKSEVACMSLNEYVPAQIGRYSKFGGGEFGDYYHSELDLKINADNLLPGWGEGRGQYIDRATALRHELGHGYGLPHSGGAIAAPLMYAGINVYTVRYPDVTDCCDWGVNCLYLAQDCTHSYWSILLIEAKSTLKKDHIRISWETSQETRIWGFNILRSVDKNALLDSDFLKINDRLIETIGSELIGAKYDFIDKTAEISKNYQYVIEVVGQEGIIKKETFSYSK